MSQPGPAAPGKLRKELGLFDVYAVSTGAMFSSGFFLLPGLAAAQTGPSVPLAYLVASVFILPAMFSVAELATAMPKAGGAYFFIDRALGPLAGTVGGLGMWFALVLKSAFALVGMGAYLALYAHVPIQPLAVALTVVFAVVNVFGAKESSGLQRLLVITLLAVLFYFIVEGVTEVAAHGVAGGASESRFTPFFAFGFTGFMGSVGFVFVSYAGLTGGVASIAEEVRDPDRNIPLGMGLSLATAAVVYTVGVYLLVAVLPASELRSDLTPVASAAEVVSHWLPAGALVALVVVAAVAAFASTGNAGIMSASRYPLAMARDHLVSPRFGKLGRFQTPTFAIGVTASLIVVAIVSMDVSSIAKLASAFQLLLFSFLALAVIIMRESGIEGYDPGFRSPLYPWMQIFGILAPLWLIAEMGELAIAFTFALLGATITWYLYYVRRRVERSGAILHTFARLGERRYHGLDRELRSMVLERGSREGDPIEQIVGTASVLEFDERVGASELVAAASGALGEAIGVPGAELARGFVGEGTIGLRTIMPGVALPHQRAASLEEPRLLLARCRDGVDAPETPGASDLRAVVFLVSPMEDPARHLRLLGHLASHAGDRSFLDEWLAAEDEDALRTTLLQVEGLVTLRVGTGAAEMPWDGIALRDLPHPKGTLIALVRRGADVIVPDGATELRDGDRLVVLGAADALAELRGDRTSRRAPRGSGDRGG